MLAFCFVLCSRGVQAEVSGAYAYTLELLSRESGMKNTGLCRCASLSYHLHPERFCNSLSEMGASSKFLGNVC